MKAVEHILRWFVIGCIFALPIIPVIVSYGLFFPYITGKSFTFRIVVDVMAGAWLALAVCVPRYRPRRSWILAAFTAFVVLMALADAFGAVPWKSFWSNYERMEGWVTIVHVLVYLTVAASTLLSEDLWRRLFVWNLGVSGFFSVWGLLQALNIMPVAQGFSSSSRVDTTFGNPIYLATYMLILVFIAGFLIVQHGNERWSVFDRVLVALAPITTLLVALSFGLRDGFASQFNSVQKADLAIFILILTCLMLGVLYVTTMFARRAAFLVPMILIDTVALLLTGTRGAMVGLIGGVVLAFILYAVQPAASRQFRYGVAIFVVLVVIAAGGLKLAQNTVFVHAVPFLDRLASISLSDGDTLARIINTETALKGIAERPILGWGQENYAVVFDKYYDPRMYAQEQWFDRVHDTVFDMWVAGGTLGLIAYLSIFAAALWALWKKGIFTAAERSVLTGLLAAYFAQNLFAFDNVTSWILFGTILGYLVYRAADRLQTPALFTARILPQTSTAFATVGVVGAVVGCAAVWLVNASALQANRLLITTISTQPQSLQDLDGILAGFQKAIGYQTFGNQEIREQLAQFAIKVVGIPNLPADVKQTFTQTAVSELDKQAKESPLDPRFPLFAANVLEAAGDYTDATTYLDKAHQLSPTKQSIYYQMAQNALLAGDTKAAVSDFKAAYELEKHNATALAYYVSTLAKAGQNSEAQSVLDAAIPATKQQAEQLLTQKQS